MEQNTSVANAPATQTTGAEKVKSGNINEGQAVSMMLKLSQQRAKQAPVAQAAENAAPEAQTAPETTSNPTAEALPPSETVAAETPEAAPENATEEAATETDSVPSQSISFTPEQQEIFNKRMARETAKTKAIQAEVEAAKARVTELENQLRGSQVNQQNGNLAASPQPTVVSTNQPLPQVNDLSRLNELEINAKQAKRYASQVLEDPSQWRNIPVPDGNGGQVEVKVHFIGDKPYTEAQMRNAKYEAETTLEDHIPAKRQFLTERQRFQQSATQKFSFLSDRNTPEWQMVEAAKRDPRNAAILSMPNSDYALALMVKGQRAMEAEEAAAKAKSAAPVVKPKIVARPSPDQTAVSASAAEARAPLGGQAQQRRQANMAKLKAAGNISKEDAAKFLLNNR